MKIKKSLFALSLVTSLAYSNAISKEFIKTINLGEICFQKRGIIYACKSFGMYLETFTLVPEDKEHTKEVKKQLNECYKFIVSNLKPVRIVTDNATDYAKAIDNYEESIDEIVEIAQQGVCRRIIIEDF